MTDTTKQIDREAFESARDAAWKSRRSLLSENGFEIPRSPKFDEWFEAGWQARRQHGSAAQAVASVPHTFGAFSGSFYMEHRRAPTGQESFDAGMRAGRDLQRPAPPVADAEGVKELVDCLGELADIVDGFLAEGGDGDGHIDTFTTQPARAALSRLNGEQHMNELKVDKLSDIGSMGELSVDRAIDAAMKAGAQGGGK